MKNREIKLTEQDKAALRKGLSIRIQATTEQEYKQFCKLADEYMGAYHSALWSGKKLPM